jgi:FtsP/CotA-like multicopper oxidase with cupredoxin domain
MSQQRGAPGGEHQDGEHASPVLEWEDTMSAMNRRSSPKNMFWKLIDRESGTENHTIDWRFTVGDRVKLRIVNKVDSDHPMQHPFDIHGQRFLVPSRDGEANQKLAWKDSVLVGTGSSSTCPTAPEPAPSDFTNHRMIVSEKELRCTHRSLLPRRSPTEYAQ